jgi:hypothetical protein
VKGLVPLAMLHIGRGRPREHHKGTSDRILLNFRSHMRAPHPSKGSPTGEVISGQKAPLGRILRNVRLRQRAPKGTVRGHVTFGHYWWRLMTSLSVKDPTRADIVQLPGAHSHAITSSQALFRWRHIRSRDFRRRHFRSGPVTWLPVDPPQMWPELSPHTTHVCRDSHEKSEGIWHKIFSSFMTCDQVCNKSKIAGLTIVAESTYRSRAPDLFSVFWEVCVVNVVFTPLLFCHDLYMLFAFIYVYWCPTRFPFQ